MDSDLDLISAKAMLEWAEELGISEAISEKPINRFNTQADENAFQKYTCLKLVGFRSKLETTTSRR